MIAEEVRPSATAPQTHARGMTGWRAACWLLAGAILAIQLWAFGSTFVLVGKPFAGFRFEPTLTVSTVGLASWPGYAAHLVQQERILAVEGKKAVGAAQLWETIRSVPAGTPIRYKVEPEVPDASHPVREVSVPTAEWTWWDLAANIMPSAVVALFFWIIGVAGFALRPENAAARVHLFFTCAMAAYFAMGVDYDFRADLGRFYPLSIYLLAATAIHLGLTFPGRARVLAKWPALLWANYGVFLAIGLAAAVVYQPLARPSFPAFDTYMVLYWQGISVALLLGVLVLLGALIGRVARPPTYQAGQQAKIALFGATAAFLPMAAFWAVPTIMKADPQATTILANSSLLFFLCFPAAVGYAIVRTKLFDIDLIIRRTLQYAFLVAVLGFGYFAISVGLGYALQTVLPRGAGEITNAVAAAAVAFAFAPLSHRTQAFLDKVFARGAYDPTLVLIEFGVAARHATE
ncbi:MAG: hypothetical protein FJZ00_14335, partial [Candidatus Sericytochromatia bacterium]|nr:hypothetical protein [Candidatus Tanganyikabacteria bacterium]